MSVKIKLISYNYVPFALLNFLKKRFYNFKIHIILKNPFLQMKF